MSALSNKAAHNRVRIEVVTSQEQLLHAFAIRSICFMEGENFKYKHAIDGNDFQSTHMVVYDEDEPIGATRVRWFQNFAKIERTAFRPNYRDPRILKRMAEEVFKHIARKGYDKVITHAGPEYSRLWQRLLGFNVVETKITLTGADYKDCVELIKHLDVPPDAVTLSSDIQTLVRIEGAWDQATWLG